MLSCDIIPIVTGHKQILLGFDGVRSELQL
jgi:hypothetical protein